MTPVHPKLDAFYKTGLLNVWTDAQYHFEKNQDEAFLCIKDSLFELFWRTDPEFKEYVINLAEMFIAELGITKVVVPPSNSTLNMLFVIFSNSDSRSTVHKLRRKLRSDFLTWVVNSLA